MLPGKTQKLSEITNTPRSKKVHIQEPETCFVVKDEEILDLRLEESESELFSDIILDFSDLVYTKKNNNI